MSRLVSIVLARSTAYLAGMAMLPALIAPGTSLSAQRAPNTRSSPGAFGQLAKQAAEASKEHRLEDAAVLYRKALVLRPRWTDGWWSLGTIEYDQDHYSKAAQAFQEELALDAHNGTAHAMLGLCQSELGQDADALRNLLEAEQLGVLKNMQLRNVALYHLGVLELRSGRYGGAKESFAQLSRDKIHTPELTSGLGMAALMIRPQEAPAEGTPGASVIQRAGEAEVLLAANEFDQARQMYMILATEFPEYPNLHFAFGRLLLETHDRDAAVEEFKKELQRDPKHVDAMLEIAATLESVDAHGGLPYAEQAARLAPHLPFAHYILGMLRLDSGDAAGSIHELEVARTAFPKEPGIYFALGQAYAHVGLAADAAKARAEFTRLKAATGKQSGPSVYGEPVDPLGRQHQEQSGELPPKPGSQQRPVPR